MNSLRGHAKARRHVSYRMKYSRYARSHILAADRTQFVATIKHQSSSVMMEHRRKTVSLMLSQGLLNTQ